jgi:2-phosphosulfolactate phosphatase
VVVIDVFRAFTTAAVALARGADAIVIVGDVDEAKHLRSRGLGQFCMGERGGLKLPGFDFGNSPSELSRAEVHGKTLILTTTNGTAGILSAQGAAAIYAAALVTAAATAAAIRSEAPAQVTLAAMGREGRSRADEDELCALYLRSRLQGRSPDRGALQELLKTMTPPPRAPLVASGQYDPQDREIAMDVDRFGFAVRVRKEGEHWVARRQDVQA